MTGAMDTALATMVRFGGGAPDIWPARERQGSDVVANDIPFNRHFYQYEPPRDLAEIDADLDVLSKELMTMLQEVHS